MFDLSSHTYDEIIEFLKNNIKMRESSCEKYKNHETFETNEIYETHKNHKNCENLYENLYELIVVSIDDKYFDNPKKTYNFKDCYFHISKYNDESYYNELSVLDCGGYYIAVCIFKNKINITNEILYNNQGEDSDEYFSKFHMNFLIKN